ncbi:hypothetical protein BDV3_006517 [Batrachochytrium dendrobatidis]|nr:mitochondrial respiratory chain complex I assembly, variant 2 [Batrachochytrium dendrobatidis]
MEHTGPVKLSPAANQNNAFDPYDYAAVIKSRDEYYKEQLVTGQEIRILRDKLRWCYIREGVNHLQNCRHLSTQLMEVMRLTNAGRLVPYSRPKPED